ncbi:Beta-propeller repeat-containing protein [Stigmatella aurantiaca]|uniref:Beta-propeller repeat-containing protein n=1 Tax=Stigmatella aurantiaca TaxID=41 RepID=A0A1H7RHU2_STIAU|nr:SBBP repeat-containing protein [Stigmatella aurantiaca]SEL59669.1 Beta-propeller repeat-containing protein [Stigmatella aurantiaca]
MLQGIGLLSLCLLAGTGETSTGPLHATPLALPEDNPSWLWQHGTEGDDAGTGIAASCEGTYSVGYTGGSFDGHPNLGNVDSFLVKHSLDGVKQWSRQFGGAGMDVAVAIASFDVNGQCVNPELYVAGHTSGSIDGTASAGETDIFLTKYDKAGNLLWSRQWGTPAADTATSVATDKHGNVYVTGYTVGALAAESAGGQDFFLVKYDAAGTLLWKRQLGTAQHEQARGVACDAEGNIYVGGHTFGYLDGNTNASNGTSTSDLFLTKYDATGQKLWTKQLGTPASEVTQGVATSRRSNGVVDIYLAGHTTGNFALPTKAGMDSDGLLVKFNDAGEVQWKKQLGTPGNDLFFGVTSDGGGNVYITGNSPNDIDTHAILDSDDVFLWVLKDTGNPLVSRQIGSINPWNPRAQVDFGAGIATDKGAGVYIAGYTEGQFSSMASAGGKDLLVFKYAEGCSTNTPAQCRLGYGWGDPHYVTFDGASYDFQGHGEFILTEASSGDLAIQARQLPWNGLTHLSVFSAFAMQLGRDRVGYYLGAVHPVKVNGQPVPISGELALPGGGRILRQGESYTFEWPTGDHLVISPEHNYVNAYLRLSPSRAGTLRGPLGNFNGNRADDFTLRDGTSLVAPLSFTQMYEGETAYVNSWRVSQAESLFDYGPGESTASFTDVHFPYPPAHTPSTVQQQQAQQLCQTAGVTNPIFLKGCITDVAATGDASFAQSAAAMQDHAQQFH